MSASELSEIEVFDGIPEEVLERIASLGDILAFPRGAELIRDGDPVDYMLVILSGAIQILLNVGGHETLFDTMRKGRVTGYLPFSRMTHSSARVVAAEPTLVYRLHRDRFQEALTLAPELGQRLVAIMSDRVREQTRGQQQRERMAALGKLSAGLAHEINNPAAAIKRATANLETVLERLPGLVSRLAARGIDEEQMLSACRIREATLEREDEPKTALERSEREDSVAEWLEEHGLADAYQRAATLVEAGTGIDDLEKVKSSVPAESLADVLAWIEATLAADRLLAEIRGASGRISEIVASVKSYSHMDRAPGQEPTDVREGIESTLVMMAHAIRAKSIRVTRADEPDLPLVPANAGELNQVWTNLIDNAIDAMSEGGELRISISREGDYLVVRVIDDGAGIPPEVLPRIFDPFFTTKPVGEGTGLGLDISQRIVTQHRGQLTVDSRPGRTELAVRLPLT
jgi:signal transduction histidine kinase